MLHLRNQDHYVGPTGMAMGWSVAGVDDLAVLSRSNAEIVELLQDLLPYAHCDILAIVLFEAPTGWEFHFDWLAVDPEMDTANTYRILESDRADRLVGECLNSPAAV